MTLEPNSTPTVVSESILNLFSRNCIRMHDLPTPRNVSEWNTCIADDDVLEQEGVLVEHFLCKLCILLCYN